jgi:hypothetical protein
MNEQTPLPYRVAAGEVARCVARTAGLLARRRVHLRPEHVGRRLRFADGTSARVYRETVVDGECRQPCVLVVEFRLRLVRARARGRPVSPWRCRRTTTAPGFASSTGGPRRSGPLVR